MNPVFSMREAIEIHDINVQFRGWQSAVRASKSAEDKLTNQIAPMRRKLLKRAALSILRRETHGGI